MQEANSNVFIDIFNSLRALPIWVQIWVFIILVPVQVASLLFLSEPLGVWIAILAILGMMPNIFIILYERGFSKLMSIPHLLPWTGLVLLIIFARLEGSAGFEVYLWVLLVITSISLIFDYIDALKWWKGDRSVARLK